MFPDMENASDSDSSYPSAASSESEASSVDSGCTVWTTNAPDEFRDQCLVENKVCSACHQSSHFPLRCAMLKNWNDKCQEDSNKEESAKSDEFAQYFAEYTNHQKNVVEEGKVSLEDFYKRLDNPKAAAEGRSSAKKAGVDEIASGSAIFEARSLLEMARKVLRESRYCLMFSCVYSYNLTDETQKSVFKFNTKPLLSSVGVLSEFLEKDVHKSFENEKRKEIRAIIDFCFQRRKAIFKYIELD